MKSFNTQTTSKPSYVKTKAFGLCGTLAIATALLLGAGTVSADETTQPVADAQPAVSNVYTADNAGNITVTPSETVAPVESQPIAETPATTTEVAQPVEAAPTSVVKNGDTITVNNPEVDVTFPNGTGKYSPFEVEYKDIEFPDSMAINEGDKVVTELPKEIGLQTSFGFDVYNNENVVGKANADAQARKITTTFNDYFTSHPLNKKMSLKFDAKWTDVVTPGKPVTVNFDGTVKTFTIGEEGPLPTDELLSKWGSQNKQDPQVINWTLRLNTARKVLNNAVLSDTWSDNQEFVEGSQNIYFVEDPLAWTGIDHSAKDYLESWNVRSDGFDAKFKEFNKIMYIDYQTRLKSAVKDSTNPTNKATLTADDSSSKSTSKVQLVGGRGDASGENKPEPTWEIPHDAPKVDIPEWNGGVTPPDAPKYDKPEFNGGVVPNEAPIYDKPELNINDIPLMPPAPVVEIPEWKGGTVPFDAPVLDKPEWNGGTVPFDAPIYDKPEINIDDIPMMPPAPILEKPELVIEIPDTPKNTPSKPADAPKEKVAQSTTVYYKLESEPKEAANTTVYGGVLPNTGEKEGIMSNLGLVVIAAGIATLTLSFKKYNDKEDK